MKEQYFTYQNIINKSKTILNDLKVIGKLRRIDYIPTKSALLVLDMQDYFLNKQSHAYIPSAEIMLPQIKKLIDIYNLNGLNIIATKHINTKENAKMMGRWWSELITEENEFSQIKSGLIEQNTIIITKSQYDAFYNTNLDELLREMGIEQLIVTGVMTHLCCETTIRSAFVRGYKCFFPVDATATYNFEFHRASFLNLSHGFAVPILAEDVINQFKKKNEY